MVEEDYELQTIQFPYFDKGDGVFKRPIPSRKIRLSNDQEVYISTVYDLMASQYGIQRFNHELEAQSMTTLNPNIHQHGKNLLLVSIEISHSSC